MDTVMIYVGSDPNMKKADVALEHSIKKTCSAPYKIIWMNFTKGGIWSNWNIGRPRGNPYPDKGWSTDFTCFRFAIPEANGFNGRAIYLDTDMILLRDINELFTLPMDKPVMIREGRWDVMLIDCSAFKDLDDWPSIEEMKPSGWSIKHYAKILISHDMVSPNLPPEWDCLDGEGYDPKKTGLIHYTDMNTQPWKPYPDRFEYPPHPHPEVEKLWWDMYNEAIEN